MSKLIYVVAAFAALTIWQLGDASAQTYLGIPNRSPQNKAINGSPNPSVVPSYGPMLFVRNGTSGNSLQEYVKSGGCWGDDWNRDWNVSQRHNNGYPVQNYVKSGGCWGDDWNRDWNVSQRHNNGNYDGNYGGGINW